MAINLSWKIDSLDWNENNEVTHAHWTVTGTDDVNGKSASITGVTPFAVARKVIVNQRTGLEEVVQESEIDPNDFTPLEQLDEETVIRWVRRKENIPEIRENIRKQILRIQRSGKPWVR